MCLYQESITLAQAIGTSLEMAESLERMGWLCGDGNDWERAARLWGAADALRAAMHAPLLPVDHAWYDGVVAVARRTLGEGGFAVARAAGALLAREEDITEAIGR